MELRHLRYFAALAEQLSFTRAAEKVHITQSTLSHQIKQLEEEIGLRLFDRVGRRIVMTEAGEKLLGSVTTALREIDAGLQSVKGVAAPISGTIHVGATHTFGINVIPNCIALFHDMHPEIRVEVAELPSGAVERALVAEEIELGIAYYPNNHAELFYEPLYIEDMVLVVSRKHPLAPRKRVRLSELHRQELVLSTKDSATRQMLDYRFQSVGAEPIVVAEMNSVSGMINLARRSEIGAVVSQLAVAEVKDLRIIPLDSPKPLRTPGLLWKVKRPQLAAVTAFIGVIRQVVSEAKMKPPR
ncbi:MAG: LysR substrate-binding domain-containing protein [Xanthobacteraceae bacterium]|jgi:LysR family cyn operon transcriptional activator